MENLNLIKPLGVQNIINKFCYTIGMIPTSYKTSLTYEEQIIAIGHYLEETVIPALNNNAEAVAELQSLFVQLKDYVENYFDNLDVQNEINVKLDEMAESGQLTDIIAQYLNLAGVLAFNTVNDMKNANNLVNGSICLTLGFRNINDKGNAKYKIRNVTTSDNVNEMNIIRINEQLVAELIIDEPLNVKQLGAYGDNIHDDTLYIRKAVELSNNIFVPSGHYILTDYITLFNKKFTGASKNRTTFIGKITDPSKPLFYIGGETTLSTINLGYDEEYLTNTGDNRNHCGIITYDKDTNLALQYGKVENVQIANCNIGIWDGDINLFSSVFENINIINVRGYGVLCTGGDRTGNVWTNIYVSNIEFVNKGNYDRISAVSGFCLRGNETECTIQQLNVEHGTFLHAIEISGVFGLFASAIHLEGVMPTLDWTPFVFIEKTFGTISNITFCYTRHRMGTSLITFGQSIHENITDATKCSINNIFTIENLTCLGLNRPNEGVYGKEPLYVNQGITNENCIFLNREAGFTYKYIIRLLSYNFRTWTYYKDDESVYKAFFNNPHATLQYLDLAQSVKYGLSSEKNNIERPFPGMQFFATDENKLYVLKPDYIWQAI